jgi:dTDP-4-dehydrorhamnose reductase
MLQQSYKTNPYFYRLCFDGTSSIALTEEAETQPINVYGSTKRAGLACLEANPDAIIIRTSWVYSRFGNNFVKTMSRFCKKETV